MAIITVVDASADRSGPLMRSLQGRGHAVGWAPNVREALATILTLPPDLIVLNSPLSRVDSARFRDVVRSEYRLQAIPIVVRDPNTSWSRLRRVQLSDLNAFAVEASATDEELGTAVELAIAGVRN